MSVLTGSRWRWSRVFAAWAVVVGSVGCDDDSGGLTPTGRQHVVRVQASGAGSGTVTAPDASSQLSCVITAGAVSGACASQYASNSAVRLVATPNGASTFSGWSGGCTGIGDCVVDMSQERTVTVAFVPVSVLTFARSVTVSDQRTGTLQMTIQPLTWNGHELP